MQHILQRRWSFTLFTHWNHLFCFPFPFWVTKRTLARRCATVGTRERCAGRTDGLTPRRANCARRRNCGTTTVVSASRNGDPAKLVILQPTHTHTDSHSAICFFCCCCCRFLSFCYLKIASFRFRFGIFLLFKTTFSLLFDFTFFIKVTNTSRFLCRLVLFRVRLAMDGYHARSEPTISSPPENVTANVNDDLALSCEARGYPIPGLIWEFESAATGKKIKLPGTCFISVFSFTTVQHRSYIDL